MKDVIEIVTKIRRCSGGCVRACSPSDMQGGDCKCDRDIKQIISELITPSPSPVTWEEMKNEADNYSDKKIEELHPTLVGTNDLMWLHHKHAYTMDYLSTRYPLHPPMEWVPNTKDTRPDGKRWVKAWNADMKRPVFKKGFEIYMYPETLTHWIYDDTLEPPSPQK